MFSWAHKLPARGAGTNMWGAQTWGATTWGRSNRIPYFQRKGRIEESELIQTIVCRLREVKRSRNYLGLLFMLGSEDESLLFQVNRAGK